MSRMASNSMRAIHRYLGFFLAGIMAVYALSGIILIFRDTDFLKREYAIEKQIKAGASKGELGTLIGVKRLKVEREENGIYYFKNGNYDPSTGKAAYTVTKLPTVIEKMTHLHKAKSKDSLFFLNIFFGLGLLFFVISSFWMFLPSTTVFKKGMYFAMGGIALTILLLFL